MTIKDLIKIYETKKEKYGAQAYRHISNVFREAKEQHKKDFTGKDHEQSWRAFKGNNLEGLVQYIIADEIKALGLKVVNGSTFERTKESNLSEELSQVKRNLLIDYGEFGYHLPDVDLIIYNPDIKKVVAIISSKVTSPISPEIISPMTVTGQEAASLTFLMVSAPAVKSNS